MVGTKKIFGKEKLTNRTAVHTSNETLMVAWCDNGMVDGQFAQGILSILASSGVKIDTINRVYGNQIGRQRQIVFDQWSDTNKSDWLLWIDSDIVLTPDAFQKVWETADKLSKPVVTGIYFISKDAESTLSKPYPAIFYNTSDDFKIDHIHPLPENKILKIDSAGFGFVLMHRSIIEPMKKNNPHYSMFAEKENLGEEYVSEDISFFRNLKKSNIPLYAHTGALVQHIKRFSLDINYYNMYWNQQNG